MAGTPNHKALERQLRKAGDSVKRATQERAAAAERLRRAVVNANRQGWGPSRIAEAAGVSRQTVHAALREDGRQK